MKRILCLLLAMAMLLGCAALAESAALTRDVVVLFTSDAHCGIDQGFFDMLLRCKIRCADGKIIDLFPLCQQFVFSVIQRSENFIAEKLQSFGKFHDRFNPFLI